MGSTFIWMRATHLPLQTLLEKASCSMKSYGESGGAVAQEIPLTISAVLLEDNAATLAVVAGLAKQYDLTIRFVRAPIQSGEEGPDQKKALEILSKTIKGMEFDGNAYKAPGLKGSITFGENLWGAFGMEQGGVLSFEEE